jgi:uncharacterized YccA/Bax inhibitor family protein
MVFPEISIPLWWIMLLHVIVLLSISLPLLVITMLARFIVRRWAADRPLILWPVETVAKVTLIVPTVATYFAALLWYLEYVSFKSGMIGVIVASIGLILLVLVPKHAELSKDDFP